MSRCSLGLDIGSNSIGWALLDTENQQMVDAGVRVFQEGVDRDTKGSEVSKNETRRTARGARRSRQRRNYRKDKLLRMLIRHGLLPEDTDSLQKVFDADPYLLRAKGLNAQLTPYEFGRVLYHLNQRRGFLSNRKTGDMKETSVVKKDAATIQKNMEQADCQTLGEYLSLINPHEQRIRGHYTFRAMYKDEFEQLWNKQCSYDGQLLTDELKHQIKDETIFFQRPLKWDKDTIGDCELEPEQKRCPRASFFARRFRILQTVNNLIIRNPNGTEQPLDAGQRHTVLEALLTRKEVTFTAIRKKLNLMETQTFNLEEGAAEKKSPKLKGDEFNAQLSANKILGKKTFQTLDEADLVEINELIINDDFSDEEVISKLMEQHDFTQEQAIEAANISLPSKYANLSELAIQKLLPYLEKGLITSDAIKAVYGDYQPGKQDDAKLDRLPLPEDLRNPIVNKALFETRKVVNALLREYGKPESIYVEMARDVKGSKRERDELRPKQWKLEQVNNEAREALLEMGIDRPSRNDIIKYKLWDECGRICPYTGKSIGQHQLFGPQPEFQIEHILPYSRTLDDSYMNKTLCCVYENIDKSNKTPYEYYEDKPEQWETILHLIAKLPYPKRRRFWQKEVKLDSFIERQINDTRYITKEVVKYLKMLGVNVWGTKGQITSELRHQWGLNDILGFTGAGLKNRDDHRHHAVDAAVTAVTRNEHLHQLAVSKYHKGDLKFDPPWPGFREQLEEKVNQINVSHRVTRKVSGQLHEETAYGPTGLKDDKGQDVFVYRKPLEALTLKMISKIVDPTVRNIVKERLAEFGVNPDKKGKIHKDVWSAPLYMKTKNGKSGPEIKKVRLHTVSNNMILINSPDGTPYRAVEPGSNHHVEIFEYTNSKGEKKCEGRVISMFEAVQRSRKGKPVICRDYAEDKKFICSLSKNELFMLEVEPGEFVLHRIQKFDQKGSVILRPHTYAGQVSDTDNPPLIQRKSPNTLQGYKVTVDPIGRIFPAND